MDLFRHFTSGDTVTFLVACGMGSVIFGFMIHAIMGDLGFGPVKNGVIVALGALGGLALRHHYVGAADPREMGIIAGTALAGGTGALILSGLFKRFMIN